MREREREKKRDRQTDRQTGRQRERERERERQRQRVERQRERRERGGRERQIHIHTTNNVNDFIMYYSDFPGSERTSYHYVVVFITTRLY